MFDAPTPEPATRPDSAPWFAPFESFPEAVLVQATTDARVLEANAAACELYGYARAELVGRALTGPAGAPGYVRTVAAGAPCRSGAETLRRRDGTPVRVEVSAGPIAHAGHPAVLAVHRPAGTSEPTEERLRQVAKMEALGHLAGGVAHDFNNLLTVITGYADVLVGALSPDDPMAAAVTEIHAAGTRAADLTRQLLTFSRKQVLRPQPVDLGRLVGNLRKMLGRLLGEDVQLVTAATPDLAPVRADPGQLEQVLVNLAVNARDAMPRGGTLTIECRNVPADESGPPAVRLTVTDTGCGMTDAVKARLFEPFFTTKELGKGTGLGLATVFGIVEQAGGRIAVESRVGVGTTFRVDLPAAEPGADPESVASARPAASRGSETVLLVEDEGAVRMMALHALQASGYAVLDAEDGEQALRIVQTFGVPIRLLVTDVVLPGFGGCELVERLRATQPHLRVLYTSGHTSDEVARRGVVAEHSHFLRKPFTQSALCQKVRDILDAPV